MFKFITRRHFLVNLFVVMLIAAMLIFGALQMLGWITNHGNYSTVPSLVGTNTTKAIDLLQKKGFEIKIIDSVYTDTAAAGIILKQIPDGNSIVKSNRTVYLILNKFVPPLLDMPKLEGQSLNLALNILARNHLKLEDTIFKPNYMLGAVIEQQYNGVRIPEKTKIKWGSKITLVVASGLGGQQMIVPDLIGMTTNQAKATLEGLGISLGAIVPNGKIMDTANAYVYQQSPTKFDDQKQPQYIQSGQLIDIFISAVMITPVTDSTKEPIIDDKKMNKKEKGKKVKDKNE